MSGRTGRTTVVYFVSQVGTSLAGFLATFVIANQLGSTVLGEYSVVVALLFWLTIPANAIGSALTKRISEEGMVDEYLGAGQALVLAFLVVVSAGVLLASDVVAGMVGHDVAGLFVLLVVANAFFSITVDALQGAKQVGRSGVLKTFEQITRTTFHVTVVLASAGFVWLVAGHAASMTIATAVGLLMLRRLPSVPRINHVRRLVEFARYSWLGSMTSRAFSWMDTIVMGAFAGYALFGPASVTHSQIGIYEAAWSLASVLALLSVSIQQTLFPELSELSAASDYERVRHFVDEGLTFTGLFLIPGLFGAAVIGGDLLAIYRVEFAQGKWILVLLVGARLVSAYGSQLLGAINAVDRPDVAFRINLAFLAVNLVANVGLVALFGWYGAAAATGLSSLLLLVASAVLLSRLVGVLAVPYREIGYQVGAGVAMFAVVVGLERMLPSTTLAAVGLVGVGAAVYGAVLLGLSGRFRGKLRLLYASL